MIFFTSLFVITIKRKNEFLNKLFEIREVLKKYNLKIFSYLIFISLIGILSIYSSYLIEKGQNIFINLTLVSIIAKTRNWNQLIHISKEAYNKKIIDLKLYSQKLW